MLNRTLCLWSVKIAADDLCLTFQHLCTHCRIVFSGVGMGQIAKKGKGTLGIKEKGRERSKRWLLPCHPCGEKNGRSGGRDGVCQWSPEKGQGRDRNWTTDKQRESIPSRHRFSSWRRTAIGIHPSQTQCTGLFSPHYVYCTLNKRYSL